MAHPAPLSKAEPLHWHTLSLRCSTLYCYILYATARCKTIRAVLHTMTYCEYTVRQSAKWISSYWLHLVRLSHAAYGLCTLCMPTVSVHRLTTYHAYSRYITVSDVASRCLRCIGYMYAISLCLYTILRYPPPKCVNFRTADEKDVDRSIFHSALLTFTKFHLFRCSSVAPSLSSSSLGSAV